MAHNQGALPRTPSRVPGKSLPRVNHTFTV